VTVIAYTLAVDGRLGCGRAWSKVDETGLRDDSTTAAGRNRTVPTLICTIIYFTTCLEAGFGLISLLICFRLTFIDSM